MSIKGILKPSFVAGLNSPPLRQLVRNLAADNALIFMLHRFQDNELGIEGHDPTFIRQCLEELRRLKYNLVSVEDIVDANLKGEIIKNAVAFTVDDGYLDHAQIGGKLFAEYDCPATFYVISRFIDDEYWPEDAKVQYLLESTQAKDITWQLGKISVNSTLENTDQRYSTAQQIVWAAKELPIDQMQLATISLAKALETDLPERAPAKYRPMSWDDARNLEKCGMRIGAHTCQHVTLSKESDSNSLNEIRQSFDAVMRNIEKPSKVFCYPTGRSQDFGQREIDILKREGYSGAVSSEPGYYQFGGADQQYTMPRMSMPKSIVDLREYYLYLELLKSKIRAIAQ